LTVENKIVDKNENIDNYNALDRYFINIQSYMKSLYKKELNGLDKKASKLQNLISKQIVHTEP